jgi:hypothetical protein
MPRRRSATTIQNAVKALVNALSFLQESNRDDEMREFAQNLADKSQEFLFERQDKMRRAREQLLELGDVESLATADFIGQLLHSYEDAAQAAAGLLVKVR